LSFWHLLCRYSAVRFPRTGFDQQARTAVVLTLISITGAMDFTADVIELESHELGPDGV
jgi:hypothetical protein